MSKLDEIARAILNVMESEIDETMYAGGLMSDRVISLIVHAAVAAAATPAIKAEALREAAEIARSRIEPLLHGDDTEYNEIIEARNVRSRFTIKDILARADEYEREANEQL